MGARFRSPLRGPWLTSVFGLVPLVALPIITITGLLSYIAYAPQLAQAIPADVGWLGPYRGGSCAAFGQATLQANQIGYPEALLALRVNGADLSLDHGYPARIIVPALPGVHNTKWVAAIEFESG